MLLIEKATRREQGSAAYLANKNKNETVTDNLSNFAELITL
jgi:hypothetical protein